MWYSCRMAKEQRFGVLSNQDYYDIIDTTLTELLAKGGVEIDEEIDAVLVRLNRVLKEALRLTN